MDARSRTYVGIVVLCVTCVMRPADGAQVDPKVAPPLKSTPAGATRSVVDHGITGVTLVPAQPNPDENFRLHVTGNGNCKLGVRTKLVSSSPQDTATSFGGVIAGLWDLSAPPTDTVDLPGYLSPMTLSKGRWAIGVSAREGFGGNCKGQEVVEVRIGAAPPPAILSAKPGGAGPAAGGVTIAKGGPANTGAGATGPAGPGAKAPKAANASAKSALARKITGVTLVPAQPKPDENFRLHVTGNGNCKLWVRTKLVSSSPQDTATSLGGVIAGLWGLSAPPTDTVDLPGYLSPMTLSKGRWAIGVSAREGFGGNCEGQEVVEVRIGGSPPAGILSVRPAGGAVAPALAPAPKK
ncbi:MAG: hypothetical protein NEA02_15500 [Thermoanaerobaculia bacterium]|nr:hypothetical protein [Thermoanaerobaculia bacterium]